MSRFASKVKGFEIPVKMLAALIPDLPHDAQVVRAGYCLDRDTFQIVVQSDEYPDSDVFYEVRLLPVESFQIRMLEP